jgi:hypothetical protein
VLFERYVDACVKREWIEVCKENHYDYESARADFIGMHGHSASNLRSKMNSAVWDWTMSLNSFRQQMKNLGNDDQEQGWKRFSDYERN